ncbi:hypothetical protein BDR06DRAFT_1023523 [Suillus hirtellus]|nr:hypothetical protein BDR06DRAFT_1023523 [Suillus hirtellus]
MSFFSASTAQRGSSGKGILASKTIGRELGLEVFSGFFVEPSPGIKLVRRADVPSAIMLAGSLLLPTECLITGWSATNPILPDIVTGIALVGAGIILNYHCVQLDIVDCFTPHTAFDPFSMRSITPT